MANKHTHSFDNHLMWERGGNFRDFPYYVTSPQIILYSCSSRSSVLGNIVGEVIQDQWTSSSEVYTVFLQGRNHNFTLCTKQDKFVACKMYRP